MLLNKHRESLVLVIWVVTGNSFRLPLIRSACVWNVRFTHRYYLYVVNNPLVSRGFCNFTLRCVYLSPILARLCLSKDHCPEIPLDIPGYIWRILIAVNCWNLNARNELLHIRLLILGSNLRLVIFRMLHTNGLYNIKAIAMSAYLASLHTVYRGR